MADDDRFTNAIHALNAALHIERCNPHDVIMLLPYDDWWKLQCSIERRYRGLMLFDGRGPALTEFRYMGISFRVKPGTERNVAA